MCSRVHDFNFFNCDLKHKIYINLVFVIHGHGISFCGRELAIYPHDISLHNFQNASHSSSTSTTSSSAIVISIQAMVIIYCGNFRLLHPRSCNHHSLPRIMYSTPMVAMLSTPNLGCHRIYRYDYPFHDWDFVCKTSLVVILYKKSKISLNFQQFTS